LRGAFFRLHSPFPVLFFFFDVGVPVVLVNFRLVPSIARRRVYCFCDFPDLFPPPTAGIPTYEKRVALFLWSVASLISSAGCPSCSRREMVVRRKVFNRPARCRCSFTTAWGDANCCPGCMSECAPIPPPCDTSSLAPVPRSDPWSLVSYGKGGLPSSHPCRH